MMPTYRLCLLLAVGAVLTVRGSSTASARADTDDDATVTVDARNDDVEALDVLRHLSRAKRELGFIGTFLGSFFLAKAKLLTWLNDAFDIPARTVVNTLASLANYFNGNQGPYGPYGDFSSWFG